MEGVEEAVEVGDGAGEGVRPEHRVAPLELTVTITQYQIVSGTNKTI